jgi:hypothetical protein
MRTLVFSSLILGLAAQLPAADRLKLDDYLGRWEIVIANSDSTFRSASLQLYEDSGNQWGEMIWKWGGVWKFKAAEALSITEGGDLAIARGGWTKPLTLRRLGDFIQGEVQDGDQHYYVVGSKGTFDVNVNGEWDATVELPDRKVSGVLRLRDDGFGRIHAEAMNEQGEKASVHDVKLEKNLLSLVLGGEDGEEGLKFAGEFRGDRMSGKLHFEGAPEPLAVTGSRKRVWAAPIQLIQENGLAGWHPRDSRAKFGWTCQGGVLTNSPPDVDIATDLEFRDFKVSLEYKVERPLDKEGRPERANSGIYLRGRYEVQILDDHGRGPGGNGSIYSRIAPKENATAAPGEWQKYEITLIGRYVTVVLNGKTLVDNEALEGITGGALDPYESLPGPLMLQGDHGKIWFRNVVVTPALPPAALP